jgi:transcriptional regulator with XRE-family HTH domain
MLDLGSRIHKARRAHGLSQSNLAREVGCKQSAISMFEGGRSQALSQKTIVAICNVLDIAWEHAPAKGSIEGEALTQQATRAFCPQAECPSNIPYLVAGEVRFLPVQQHHQARTPHCRYCGELLEHTCPECGVAVTTGACCGGCGCAYVVGGPSTNLQNWVQAQREIAMRVASTTSIC